MPVGYWKPGTTQSGGPPGISNRSGAPRGVRTKGGSCPALENSSIARGDVEDGRERGHEELLGILVLDLVLRAREHVAHAPAAQRRALQVRLHRRHEERRGQSLARDVGHDEEEVRRIDHEAVVEIAADGARRLEQRRELEAPVRSQRLPSDREGVPSGCAAPRPPRPPCAPPPRAAAPRCRSASESVPTTTLPNTASVPIAGQAQSKSIRVKPEEHEAHEEGREHQRDDEVDALQRRQPRDEPDEDQPRHDEQHRLRIAHDRRAHERHAVEQVLDHLRVHRDAGHELTERRGLVVLHAEPADADQDDLVADRIGIDLAGEHRRPPRCSASCRRG